MTETMQAVRIHQFGGSEVLTLEEVARPEAGPGELLVRVHAAGINPIDCAARRGAAPWLFEGDPLPFIDGWDVSGVVADVGAGVTGFAAGDEVFALSRFPAIASAYAEYAAVPAADAAAKPRSIDHLHAGGVPLAALTAWQALFDAAGLAAGQTALIHAAAGGVGHFAVQFAKWKGATVIGTGSARNEGFLRELGADRFVDYGAERVEDVVSDIDVQLDSLGADGRERCWGVMKQGGTLVSIRGPVSDAEAASHGVRARAVRVRPDGGQLAEIAALIDAGAVRPVLDSAYPLADAAAAHDHVEGGHSRGKVVLRIAD